MTVLLVLESFGRRTAKAQAEVLLLLRKQTALALPGKFFRGWKPHTRVI